MSAAVPAIVAGSALVSAYQGYQANKAAGQATDDMKRRADQEQSALIQRQTQMRQQQGALSYVLRSRLLSGAKGGGDQGGTILSGPLGVGSSVLGS